MALLSDGKYVKISAKPTLDPLLVRYSPFYEILILITPARLDQKNNRVLFTSII